MFQKIILTLHRGREATNTRTRQTLLNEQPAGFAECTFSGRYAKIPHMPPAHRLKLALALAGNSCVIPCLYTIIFTPYRLTRVHQHRFASHTSGETLDEYQPYAKRKRRYARSPRLPTAALEAEVAALRQELNEVRVLNRIIGAVSTAHESITAFARACEELAQAFAVPQVALAVLDTSPGALHVGVK